MTSLWRAVGRPCHQPECYAPLFGKRIAGTVDAQELVCSVRSLTRLAESEWVEQFEVPMMYAMVMRE